MMYQDNNKTNYMLKKKVIQWTKNFDVEKVDQYVTRCLCGRKALILFEEQEDNRKVWFIKCRCGNESKKYTKKWRAILRWNRSDKSKFPSFKKIPVFGLKNIKSKHEAYKHLIQLKPIINQRKKELKNKFLLLRKKHQYRTIMLNGEKGYITHTEGIIIPSQVKREFEKIDCMTEWLNFSLLAVKKNKK